MKAHSRRYAHRHGEDVTLLNYTQQTDGSGNPKTDEYGDPLFDESSESAKAVVDFPTEGESISSDAGVKESIIAIFRVSANSTIRAPSDDNPKGTIIKRARTGNKFDVETAVDDASGLIQAECTRHEQ